MREADKQPVRFYGRIAASHILVIMSGLGAGRPTASR